MSGRLVSEKRTARQVQPPAAKDGCASLMQAYERATPDRARPPGEMTERQEGGRVGEKKPPRAAGPPACGEGWLCLAHAGIRTRNAGPGPALQSLPRAGCRAR